jgi:purine nucleoside phosphorylase
MHGWRKGVSRGRASRQVFSVLHRAGVRRILSDAGVGSLNHLLDPGDLVSADDFVDLTTDRDRYGRGRRPAAHHARAGVPGRARGARGRRPAPGARTAASSRAASTW